MSKVNIKTQSHVKTYEGGRGVVLSPEKELTRVVMTCMLFEDTFYEKGSDMADRIKELCRKVKPEFVAELAIKAREDMYLRSVPLFLVRELARITKGRLVSETLARVIQRADELSEFLAIYWLDGRQPLSAQVKKGIAKAFQKFSEYDLQKYNRDNTTVKLRDALFLSHAKPKDDKQAEVWKKLIDDKLEIPDTWETQLSNNQDKKETFERLIRENKLGYMATLRNLRNMEQADCDIDLVCNALLDIEKLRKSRVLPFRFIAAEQNVNDSKIKQAINKAFLMSIEYLPKLEGVTIILVDVSGSMNNPLSSRSDMRRMDAAGALAAVLKENLKSVVYSFSDNLVKVTSTKRGMAFINEMINSQPNNKTYLGSALEKVNSDPCDRVIVITDEQTHDNIIPCWAPHGYIINVAGYKPSVAYYSSWEVIAGWSDKIINYIYEIEKIDKS